MRTPLVILIAVLLASSLPVHAQLPASKRPPVGIPDGATFFQGKWYRLYTERCTWKRAKDKCEQLDGHLVVIPDEATQTFVRQLAKGLTLWLGATDEKVNGLWLWTDGTEMKYTYWHQGEPHNEGGHEQYLEIWNDGGWNDAQQNDPTVVGYICEWKAR